MATSSFAKLKGKNTNKGKRLVRKGNQCWRNGFESHFSGSRKQSDWMRPPEMESERTIVSALLVLSFQEVGGGSGHNQRHGVLARVIIVSPDSFQQKREERMSRKWSTVPFLTVTEKPRIIDSWLLEVVSDSWESSREQVNWAGAGRRWGWNKHREGDQWFLNLAEYSNHLKGAWKNTNS